MIYDVFEASRRLSVINLNLDGGIPKLSSYWCRVVVSEREIHNPHPHTHSFFELHLCLSGEGKYTVGNTEIILHEKEYILLPPCTIHKIESEPEGYRKLIWGFNPKDSSFETELCDSCGKITVHVADEELIESIDVILSEAYFTRFGYYDVIRGRLSSVFSQIVRDCTDLSETDSFGKKPSFVIADIKRYIVDNLRLSPTKEEIAVQFSKSAGTLDKMCFEECGMTVSSLRRSLQFEEIKRLLHDTDLTFDEIADLCGFADRYTMGKFFRKYEGVPPGEFRRWSRE